MDIQMNNTLLFLFIWISILVARHSFLIQYIPFSLPYPFEQTRTSTDPEDVQQMALHMAEKNRQAGQDLDRIFMQRKQRETETAQVQ